MPRTLRADEPAIIVHAINRGNGRARLFHKDADYVAFGDCKGDVHLFHDRSNFLFPLRPGRLPVISGGVGSGSLIAGSLRD